MKNSKRPVIAVVGGMNLDVTGSVSAPLRARDSNIGAIRFAPGGVGRNIAERLARAGAHAKLYTCVSDDFVGRILEAACRDAGIDLSMARRVHGRGSCYMSVHGPDGDMALALSEASALAATLNTEIVSFSGNMSTAISGGLSTVSAASTRANAAVGDAATGIQAAQGDVEYATSVAQNVIDGNKEIISYLQAVADDAHLTQDQRDAVNAAIATLSQSNANAEANLKSMNALAASASSAAGSIANASSTVNDAVQKSVDNGRAYNDDLSKNTIPAVSQGLSGLASTAGSLSGTVARQTSLIDQTSLVLDQLISTLNTTVDALGQTDALLADVQGDIDTVRTDVVALGTSGALAKLFGEDGTLDVNKIADFMQSPTQLETEQLYPLNAYGSAMSPLFINLTLWIGVFMLMVIMHIEVDDEEIRNLTIAQRFLGRGILFAIMVSLQAIVCVTGCLFLGVQAEKKFREGICALKAHSGAGRYMKPRRWA